MSLIYRGMPYQPAAPAEVTETEQTAHFLGRSYKILQRNADYRQSSAQLRYRGIDYIT